MSKSKGNVIDPLELLKELGTDSFRYFLMREMNVSQDSNFSKELFMARYNSDLANDLGNLVSRLLNMTSRYCNQSIPVATICEDPEKELKQLWAHTAKDLPALFDTYKFHTGLENIFTFIRGINRYAEIRSPWKLAKSKDLKDRAILETSLAFMAEGVRLATLYLEPIMPETVQKLNDLLGVQKNNKPLNETLIWSDCLKGATLGEKVILFPKPEAV